MSPSFLNMGFEFSHDSKQLISPLQNFYGTLTPCLSDQVLQGEQTEYSLDLSWFNYKVPWILDDSMFCSVLEDRQVK